MLMPGQAHIVEPGAGRSVDLGVVSMRVIAGGESTTGGNFTLAEFYGSGSGAWTVPHLHRGFEESFYVLDGLFTFTVGNEEREATPGTYILVPRGTAHTIQAAEGGGRFLTLMVPGGLRFVGVSSVWGGGMAIYDARARSEIAARAYLISAEQFVDVLAQEMRLEPDLDVNLSAVRETGWHSLGAGRYQTLAHLGDRDDLPMLTFTSADVYEHPLNAPTEGYLRTIAVGLRESHGWSRAEIGRYLAQFPGAVGTWSAASIAGLAA